MSTIFNSNIDFNTTQLLLKTNYPNCKVLTKNEHIIKIIKGKIAVIIKFYKNKVKIHGDMYLKTSTQILFLFIILLTGFIGVIVLYILKWIFLSRKIKHFKKEIFNVIER